MLVACDAGLGACEHGAVRAVAAKIAAAALVVVLVGVLAVLGKAWWDSRLPGTYSVMDYGTVDYGGGPEGAWHAHAGHNGGTSVSDLRGPAGAPDARFVLTARHATIQLASGRAVEALTFDGRSPGPELRVRQGDLVEVTLVNEDVDEGVTIHWHGVDVPNAEDGVAGVTQDAVHPGERHVYRFRVEQVGTFWYHTHQVSSKEVRRGLFGVLVIEPRDAPSGRRDLTVVAHTFDGVPTLNRNDSAGRERVAAGTPVRLRLVNTDSAEQRLTVTGTPFRVLAIDGTDLNEPGKLENVGLLVPAGGRFDVGFTMPARGVRVGIGGTDAAVVLGPSRAPVPAEIAPTEDFDPLSYGEPAPTPFDAASYFDRRFDLTITRKPGFFDGHPGLQWAINGHIYPDVPMFVVDQGDLVEVTITNDSKGIHPMHLHGHHVLVLSRDGVPASGSPWWSDTLDVRPGESYVVGFRADNPGLWMDHCHNLKHAADGLTMHVAYLGVSTPFEVGAAHHNTPE
jgi:FtsP/CotA-like multicopper oxidase with cupredoxin domain